MNLSFQVLTTWKFHEYFSQAFLIHKSRLTELGTMLSLGAEIAVKGVFHPSLLFQENRMILEQNGDEIGM